MRIVAHPPRQHSCCSPCDAVTLHFAGDDEIHVYATTRAPERLAARLARFARELIEFPSAVPAIAGDEGATSSRVVRRAR